MSRAKKRNQQDPSSLTWFFAEGRNRVTFMFAALFLLLAIVLFALFLLPDNATVYLYQTDAAETESVKKLVQAFKLKTGKVVDVRSSGDTESLKGVLDQDWGPRLVVFHAGAGMDAIGDRIMALPESLAVQLDQYLEKNLSSPVRLMVMPLGFEPLGVFTNKTVFELRGMTPFHTLEQLMARFAKYGTLYPGGLVLPGGNDRHLVNFLSALVVSFWGSDAYATLCNAIQAGTGFADLLELDLSPGFKSALPPGVEPDRPTLGGLLDLLALWTRDSRLQPRWFRLASEEVLRSASPFSSGTYIMPAGFGLTLSGAFNGNYRFQYFPDSTGLPGYHSGPLSGPVVYLARTVNTSRLNNEAQSLAADEFFAFAASPEGRAILARQPGFLVYGSDGGTPKGDLEETRIALGLRGRPLAGLWYDAFDRLGQDRWTADTIVSRLCRDLRDYLHAHTVPVPLSTASPLP